MKCKICSSENIKVIYNDYIRNGEVGKITDQKYKMYQCDNCGVIWHDVIPDSNKEYYESEKYRKELENSADIESYYKIHDTEVLEKLNYTGTNIFRHKRVADVGCGGGSFLDFISGVASEVIAIEPSNIYRMGLEKKGYLVTDYSANAVKKGIEADVVTSFDVIEHVDDPISFLRDIYDLLKKDGTAIVGTPTDAPLLRKFIGHEYEQFLFSYQHPWVLSARAFKLACVKAGFNNVIIEQKQRYGLTNAMMWLRDKKPCGHIQADIISGTLEELFKKCCEEQQSADYIVAYLKK
ncbi:MAG: class I SAM-dependent methyltransferase [Butyrivibrio sp.]|jgi:2-polyprenyl-3-methyl-5-hydroxy-6-metoxy-1,4-benzoquinol methylase|nr:class I SAM-dependent methyltransferase [Butyrivibrio sp.]